MSTTLDALQSLDAPPLTVAVLALAATALVVTDPLLGRRDHRALLVNVAADPAGGEAARLRFYRRWSRGAWTWAAVVVALVVALPGVGPGALGLTVPDVSGGAASVWRDGTGAATAGDGWATVAGMLVGALAAVGLSVVALRLAARRRRRTDGPTGASRRPGLPVAGAAALEPMLPMTARGRRGWAGLALAAGVTEEVTYRGLVVLTLAVLLPPADPRVVVVAAAVLFGLAHAYQGPTGMLATGVAGAAFTSLYLSTGSLVLPMALHVLLDLRVLLLTPAGSPRRDAAAGQPVPA